MVWPSRTAVPRWRRTGQLAAATAFLVTAAAAPSPAMSADRPADPLVCRSSGTARGYLLSKGGYTTIDAPKAGPETVPTGINNRGQVVGAYVDAANRTHGFLLDHGRYVTLDAPFGTYTVLTDINDRGLIVGSYSDSSGTCHGFRLDHGTFTRSDVPGAVGTQPFGVNDSGQISGTYSDTAGGTHGFLRAGDGTLTTIDGSKPGNTLALKVNDRGQVAGVSVDSQTPPAGRGFLWRRGVSTPVVVPGAVTTIPFAANNTGTVVGQYADSAGKQHSFGLRRGAVTVLDTPGAGADSAATDVNDGRQIIGFSVDTRTGTR